MRILIPKYLPIVYSQEANCIPGINLMCEKFKCFEAEYGYPDRQSHQLNLYLVAPEGLVLGQILYMRSLCECHPYLTHSKLMTHADKQQTRAVTSF